MAYYTLHLAKVALQNPEGEWIHLQECKLKVWIERPHSQLDFNLAQVMSSHGVFNKFLKRMESHCQLSTPTVI